MFVLVVDRVLLLAVIQDFVYRVRMLYDFLMDRHVYDDFLSAYDKKKTKITMKLSLT